MLRMSGVRTSSAGAVSVPRPAAELTILIPVFNDWKAVALLLEKLDEELRAVDRRANVLLVDDGSTSLPYGPVLRGAANTIERVDILHLRRNLGHQRAIAVGLTYLEQSTDCPMVVVMDGDGEDRPSDVPRLLAEAEASTQPEIVFAARHKRSEGLVFRAFYGAYRAIHRILTGIPVNVGNFSVVPREALRRLVVVSEIWNHYAAAVFHARLPHRLVGTARGERLAGKPTMNFVSLVAHGLSALFVHGEVLGVRALLAAGAAFVLMCLSLGAIIAIRLLTSQAIPGWATTAGGIVLILMSQLIVLGVLVTSLTIGSRMNVGFIPVRDFAYFVGHVEVAFVRTRTITHTGLVDVVERPAPIPVELDAGHPVLLTETSSDNRRQGTA